MGFPVSPVSEIISSWNKASDVQKECFSVEFYLDKISAYVEWLMIQPTCICIRDQSHSVHCNCMNQLRDMISSEKKQEVAMSLFEFACMTPKHQGIIVKEWMKYAMNSSTAKMGKHKSNVSARVYILPGTNGGFMICRNALARLIGYSYPTWNDSIRDIQENNTVHHDRNWLQTKHNEHNVLMHSFFNGLDEVIPCIESEQQKNDNDNNTTFLANHSRISLYSKMLEANGWKFVINDDQKYVHMEPLEGTNKQTEVPSWRNFNLFWDTHYPFLVVHNDATNDQPYANSCQEGKKGIL